MDIINYFYAHHNLILNRTLEHLIMCFCSISIATISAIPAGVLLSKNKLLGDLAMYIASIIFTIPSIAIFGLIIPILSKFGYGIGAVPGIIAVIIYAFIPIFRNTYTAIINIDSKHTEAAISVGMTFFQRMTKVEIPIALSSIISGVRIAVVYSVGILIIAAFIGGGGLGVFIFKGISQSNTTLVVVGMISVSLLAILLDMSLGALERKIAKKIYW